MTCFDYRGNWFWVRDREDTLNYPTSEHNFASQMSRQRNQAGLPSLEQQVRRYYCSDSWTIRLGRRVQKYKPSIGTYLLSSQIME